jgi:hypothetical protein
VANQKGTRPAASIDAKFNVNAPQVAPLPAQGYRLNLRETMNITDIPAIQVNPAPEDIKLILKDLPRFPMEPRFKDGVLESILQEAVSVSGSFADILYHLYPTFAGELFAAGLLAKRTAKEETTYRVGETVIDLDQSVYPPRGHVGIVGDLEVEGDLEVIAALVVTGNLRIKGLLIDCGPESRVVVLGDLVCEGLYSSGWVLVGGNLQVSGVVYGEYNDDALEVLGDINAGVIVTDEHGVGASGSIRVSVTPQEPGNWGEQQFDIRNKSHVIQLKTLLGEDAITERGQLSPEAMRRFAIF